MSEGSERSDPELAGDVDVGGDVEASTPVSAGARPGLRGGRRVLWIAVAVAIPLALFVLALATRPPASSRTVQSPLIGKNAPAISASTIDGKPFRLADARGRWVVLNFFATWCVPCRLEHDDLVRFQNANETDGDATVVGVVYSDSDKAVREFRDAEGGTWPMLSDPKGRISLDFGVAGVPESFLIDPSGVVVTKILGGIRDTDLETILAQARDRYRSNG